MVRSFKNLKQAVRELSQSDWEHCVPIRWLAQMGLGILPGVVVLALLMKAAHEPLAPHPTGATFTNVASIIPMFSASAVAESPSFHRLELSQSVAASAEVQFRHSTHLHQALPVLTAAAVAEAPLEHDFNQPRSSWQHLGKGERAALDALFAGVSALELDVVIHGGRHFEATPRRLGRYLSEVRGAAQGACDIVISGRGVEVLSTASGEGPLDIMVAGDFQLAAPTLRQLEALDEVLDYLSVKADRLQVLQHLPDANVVTDSCLGRHFPIRQIMAEINESE